MIRILRYNLWYRTYGTVGSASSVEMGQEVRYRLYSLLLMRASGWPQQETYTCSEEGLLGGRTWDLRTDCDGRYRDKKGAPLLERYEMVMDGMHVYEMWRIICAQVGWSPSQ